MTKIQKWHHGMSDAKAKDLAYWERNVLALHFADGWYDDDVWTNDGLHGYSEPRYTGWRRVLSLEGGKITFHIPDDFDVGNLPQIRPNWDGHATEDKWRRILERRRVSIEP